MITNLFIFFAAQNNGIFRVRVAHYVTLRAVSSMTGLDNQSLLAVKTVVNTTLGDWEHVGVHT